MFQCFAPFRTIFLLRSFSTGVGQTDAHRLENGRKRTRERAATGARGRERRTEHTLHLTKCAMVVFHATSVWHMHHVCVRVGNIARLTWPERSWLRACEQFLAAYIHMLYARKEDVVAHGPWSGFLSRD